MDRGRDAGRKEGLSEGGMWVKRVYSNKMQKMLQCQVVLINQGETIIGSSLPCTYIPDLRYIHESEVSEGLSDLQFTGQLHIH